MAHRAHLFSLRLGHALRESCVSEGYNRNKFTRDVLAGITVGIIAIPLSMALAIGTGVAPQHGLYTAIVAGILAALLGGSRYSITGPTAAFIVILHPITQQYGLAGLMVASIMAGGILVLMALLRWGRWIEYIPHSVVLGFTSGIAVVIAVLQISDAFGLAIEDMPAHFNEKIAVLWQAAPGWHWPTVVVTAMTLLVMVLWPRLRTRIPPHLPAVVVGAGVSLLLAGSGLEVDTIASRFSYTLPDGETGRGIPPMLPQFVWPWHQAGPGGGTFEWSWQMVRDLVPAAFAIAMLGAIESLLCAVILDGMSGERHSANSELMGQGIANLVTPFFGGITATAAISRSAVNLKAGARTPLAAVVQSLVVLLALVLLAPLLAYLPMAAMAALLLMVAWSMSETPRALRLLKTAPRGDVLVFLTCFALTVLIDMVVAITAGVLLAALLFMKEIAEMTRVSDISTHKSLGPKVLPDGWAVYKINGPLFFAAADRVFGELATLVEGKRGVVLYFDAVPVLDSGGVSALEGFVKHCKDEGIKVYLADLQFQPLRTLARAGIQPVPGVTRFFSTLHEALSELPDSPAERA